MSFETFEQNSDTFSEALNYYGVIIDNENESLNHFNQVREQSQILPGVVIGKALILIEFGSLMRMDHVVFNKNFLLEGSQKHLGNERCNVICFNDFRGKFTLDHSELKNIKGDTADTTYLELLGVDMSMVPLRAIGPTEGTLWDIFLFDGEHNLFSEISMLNVTFKSIELTLVTGDKEKRSSSAMIINTDVDLTTKTV